MPKKKVLAFEVQVTRTFYIEGDDYVECWHHFKQAHCDMAEDERWTMPASFDRGGVEFDPVRVSPQVTMSERSSHLDHEHNAPNVVCPECECGGTLIFKLTSDATGRLDPLATCGNCGHRILFCDKKKSADECSKCVRRVDCLVK